MDSFALDTIALAQTLDPARDFIIGRQPDGAFWLTVNDPVEERADVTTHPTVEEAQREAARISGAPNLRWSKPSKPIESR